MPGPLAEEPWPIPGSFIGLGWSPANGLQLMHHPVLPPQWALCHMGWVKAAPSHCCFVPHSSEREIWDRRWRERSWPGTCCSRARPGEWSLPLPNGLQPLWHLQIILSRKKHFAVSLEVFFFPGWGCCTQQGMLEPSLCTVALASTTPQSYWHDWVPGIPRLGLNEAAESKSHRPSCGQRTFLASHLLFAFVLALAVGCWWCFGFWCGLGIPSPRGAFWTDVLSASLSLAVKRNCMSGQKLQALPEIKYCQ